MHVLIIIKELTQQKSNTAKIYKYFETKISSFMVQGIFAEHCLVVTSIKGTSLHHNVEGNYGLLRQRQSVDHSNETK